MKLLKWMLRGCCLYSSPFSAPDDLRCIDVSDKGKKVIFIPDSAGTIFVGMSASAVTEKENIGVLLCSVVGFVSMEHSRTAK